MATLPYCRPDRIRATTWALDVGTSVGGDFVEAALVDSDPSLPLWIEETTIAIQGDCGSAVRIDGLALIHHNFQAGTQLRARLDTTAPPGSPGDVDVIVTVGAWIGRFAPHVYFNFAAAAPVEANRTRQYPYVENLDANDVPIQIGEIVVAGQVDTLTRGIRVGFEEPTVYGRSLAEGKKGPQFIHDRRTRDRSWIGSLGQDATDYAAFKAWHDASYGVLPFLVWPENSITGEPVLARFLSPSHVPARVHSGLATIALELRELACGEAY